MADRRGYAPVPETRAIAAASLKAGAFGALIICLFLTFFAFSTAAPLADRGIFSVLWFMFLLYAIAFVAGTIGTGLMLLVFGALIARISRDVIGSWAGLAIAITSAVALSTSFALIFASSGQAAMYFNRETAQFVGGLSLVFALPAAILYRREILTEQIVD